MSDASSFYNLSGSKILETTAIFTDSLLPAHPASQTTGEMSMSMVLMVQKVKYKSLKLVIFTVSGVKMLSFFCFFNIFSSEVQERGIFDELGHRVEVKY